MEDLPYVIEDILKWAENELVKVLKNPGAFEAF